MMKLLFDLCPTQPSGSTKRHGGGKYGEVVFKRIVERGLPVIAFYDSSKWINSDMLDLIKDNAIQLFDKQQIQIQDLVRRENVKRLYSPIGMTGLGMNLGECEVYGTVHGTRPMELQYDPFIFRYNSEPLKNKIKFLIKGHFPSIGYRNAKKWYKYILQDKKSHFVMVSHHSACSLHSYLPKETFGKNIPVFYSPKTSLDIKLEKKTEEKYYLIVSGNRFEKNALRGIIAFDRLFSAGYLKDSVVKITGAKDASCYRYKILNPDRFHFLGYVDDMELEQLYHDAYAFVYPSINEGFGYPPMEAMRHGTPTLTSAHTSISEICEGAALYFNPFSVEEIMARILAVGDSVCNEKYKKLSYTQYKKVCEIQERDLDDLVDYLYHE